MLSLDTPSTVALCTISIVLTTLYGVHLRSRRPKLPLPPGPPKLSLVGNLFDVPSTFQWKSYAQWSQQYALTAPDSDIIHLNMAGTSNDFPMVNELMGWHFNIGKGFYSRMCMRTHRRLINGGFNAKAARKYEPTELVGTHGLLARLLHAPEDFMAHFRQYFPGAGFKRQAEEWSKLARGMLEVPFGKTKRQMALDDPNNEPYYQEHHVKQAAAALYVGGADTSVSVLGTFVLAMLAYPEVQKKAQAEIDSLTAGKYLPTFEDEASLPYIAALVKEVLRWENVAPLGGFIVVPNPVVKSDGFLPAPPRLLGEDNEYRG
ncbi:cytochrome P450 [Mycena olivaceomarginata]|nr:cytochrome P450 [Mycena olivaceomarginata]